MKVETLDNTFLICARDEPEVAWLSDTLAAQGKVISGGENLEEICRLVDMMAVSVLFVGIDRRRQVQQCTLIESVLEARPMVAVVAVGDGGDSDLVIAAMRAGARDFLTYGLRASEVGGLVRRLVNRLPQLPARGEQAAVTLIYGAQPDPDAALLATHLALALTDSDQAVLLVDIGIPAGESKAILDVECTFHFDDALRNLRRLDGSVIESAFAEHDSGLRVLPLIDDGFALESCQSAELFLLLGSLKQYFDQIIINACGQRDSDLMRALGGGAERLLWYVDQSVPCSRRNLALLERWRANGVKLDHCHLVVDRYLGKQAPDAATLANTFDIPLIAAMPWSAPLRLQSRNQGEPLQQLAPRDELVKSLQRLARQLSQPRQRAPGLLQRLWEAAR